MKTAILLLLFSTISLSLSQSSVNLVCDIDGNILRSGEKYYILPVVRGKGGGLTLGSTRNGSLCPLDVVQANLEVDKGLPLTFTPVNPEKSVIHESTDLNIVFSAASICVQSNVWMLELYDGQFIVTGTGVSGNPGQQTVSNWFMIQKFEDDYKILTCPTVCKICRPPCGDIGVTITKNGRRRLALSATPFKVMFKKA